MCIRPCVYLLVCISMCVSSCVVPLPSVFYQVTLCLPNICVSPMYPHLYLLNIYFLFTFCTSHLSFMQSLSILLSITVYSPYALYHPLYALYHCLGALYHSLPPPPRAWCYVMCCVVNQMVLSKMLKPPLSVATNNLVLLCLVLL